MHLSVGGGRRAPVAGPGIASAPSACASHTSGENIRTLQSATHKDLFVLGFVFERSRALRSISRDSFPHTSRNLPVPDMRFFFAAAFSAKYLVYKSDSSVAGGYFEVLELGGAPCNDISTRVKQ